MFKTKTTVTDLVKRKESLLTGFSKLKSDLVQIVGELITIKEINLEEIKKLEDENLLIKKEVDNNNKVIENLTKMFGE